MKLSIDRFAKVGFGTLLVATFLGMILGHVASLDTLPDAKRTASALYLEAKDVPAFIESNGGASRVLFLDVRTRAEAMFVGMADSVDGLAPHVELQELMTDWDA